MGKNTFRLKAWSVESLSLLILFVLFVGTLGAAWIGAMSLHSSLSERATSSSESDPGGLAALENLRTLANSKFANRRIYFYSGSESAFEKQKSEDREFTEGLAAYRKRYEKLNVGPALDNISETVRSEEDFFKQGIDFMNKPTPYKIVAQFYGAKVSPLMAELNSKFNELQKARVADLEQSRQRIQKAEADAQASIPNKMLILTCALAVLFGGFSILILRLLGQRRRLLSDRDRLANEAKNAILSRDEVTAAVANDLKDPIAQLLAVEGTEDVKFIAAELQNSINEIVDQKRADLGDLSLRLEQYNLSDVIDRAQVTVHGFAKSRDVTVQYDGGNHAVLAYVDVERVHRVLVNLIGNAIKFSSRHSKVIVKVKSDPQFANVSVIDSGSGIPADRIEGIFDNFWQAKKTSGQGAGVSLAVVKSIIEAHGGSVRAEKSKIDSGTVITFSLPRRRPANAPIRKPTSLGVRPITRPQVNLDN